mgnify:FL=1
MFVLAAALVSCKGDSCGKELFADVMNSRFTMQSDYTFSSGEKALEGSLVVSSGENIKMELVSPDALCGVAVESDGAGKMSEFSVSFSGIKADIPKSILTKLSLAFGMFSPDMPQIIRSLDSGCISENSDTDAEFVTAMFSQGDVNYSFTYNRLTGEPTLFVASAGEDSVTLRITKFKSESGT